MVEPSLSSMAQMNEHRTLRQVPSLWRPVVEDPATLQLFLNTYTSCQPPLSSQALECLVSPVT